MSDYSRRTHIVRVSFDTTPPDPGQQPNKYVDMEVLDAISFRLDSGKEVILDMAASNSAPLIVDNTGGGHGKKPSGTPTQRTNMKRISDKLDVEVMGAMSFRDQNGGEWILDMQDTTGGGPAIFDTTDNSGDRTATRRVHDEKISDPFGEYLTSQRCDAIAFRTTAGYEVVLSCPSSDDPDNTSAKRASTYVSPEGYDPTDDTEDAVAPPSLDESGDPHIYVVPVASSDPSQDPNSTPDFMTGDEKIHMGPFWWIRKVSGGSGYLFVEVTATGPIAPAISINISPDDKGKPSAKVISQEGPTIKTTGGTDFKYFVWSDIAPLPTLDDWGNATFWGVAYAGQFSGTSIIQIDGDWVVADFSFLVPGWNALRSFTTLEDAQIYADAFNANWAIPNQDGVLSRFTGFMGSDGTVFSGDAPMVLHAGEIGPFGGTSVTVVQSYLLKISSAKSIITITVDSGSNSTSSLAGYSYTDPKHPPKPTPKPPYTTLSAALGPVIYTIAGGVFSNNQQPPPIPGGGGIQ
jgi:hypothetical protein